MSESDEAKAHTQAIVAVMGDDSDESQSNAWNLQWAFHALVQTFCAGGGKLTLDVLRETIPDRLFELAATANWIPYFDDDGNPDPEKEGKAILSGWYVTQELYEAFFRLLPFDDYIEGGIFEGLGNIKELWVRPTPKEIVKEVLTELDWTEPQLVEAMMAANGTQYFIKHYELHGKKVSEREPRDWQNSKERKGLENLLTPPLPNARRNKAQADHRKALITVIHQHSKKHATMPEEWLKWRPAEHSKLKDDLGLPI